MHLPWRRENGIVGPSVRSRTTTCKQRREGEQNIRRTYVLNHIFLLARLYVHIYTYSTLKFVDKIFIEVAIPEKALKYALFQKV